MEVLLDPTTQLHSPKAVRYVGLHEEIPHMTSHMTSLPTRHTLSTTMYRKYLIIPHDLN